MPMPSAATTSLRLLVMRDTRTLTRDPAQEIEEAEAKLAARLHDTFKVKIGAQAPEADLARLARVNVNAFLIGESLMRQQDVTAATQAILTKP